MKKLKKDEIEKKIRVEGYDSLTQEEMIKYSGSGKKFKLDLSDRVLGSTPLGKLVTKNANRSVIKKDRQQAKTEISKEIQ
jgi:hypothetical protein